MPECAHTKYLNEWEDFNSFYNFRSTILYEKIWIYDLETKKQTDKTGKINGQKTRHHAFHENII
jgi:hypothetical protein